MRKEELPTIWAYASALWGTFKVPDTKERFEMSVQVWSEMLGKYDASIIKAGMIELSKENDFCTVGKLAKHCEIIQKLANGEMIDVDEIVQKIVNAVQRADKQQAFDNLPEIAKKVVGNKAALFKWGKMDSSVFNSVVISNLRKSVEKALETKEKLETMETLKIPVIPTGLQQEIRLSIEDIEI